ncbi:MAG TPA: hypothetical protein VIJ51_10180 [Solirubrobacteraceae bacterium]
MTSISASRPSPGALSFVFSGDETHDVLGFDDPALRPPAAGEARSRVSV